MSYKTKIGIAIGIGVVFIIIMAVVMVIFVQSTEENSTSITNVASSNISNSATSSNENETNTTSNTVDEEDDDNTNKNIDLDEIESFGLQTKDAGTYIVGILSDSTSKSIINTSDLEKNDFEFENYDYYNENLYLLYIGDEYLQIYDIDLNSNEQELVLEKENNYMNSFACLNGNIYYVTNSNSIYMYDIQNDSENEIINLSENEEIKNAEFDKNNNIVYYLKNVYDGEGSSGYVCKIGLEDIENIEEETIISIEIAGSSLSFGNNCLAINFINEVTEKDEEGKEELKTYNLSYVYNIESNNVWELGNIQISETTSDISISIAFAKDYIAFSDGTTIKLTDYDGNIINEELYTVSDEDCYIVDIEMISSNVMQIRIRDNVDNDFSETTIIDFTSESSKNISRNYFGIILK